MPKYHLNNRGEIKPCTATRKPCRYGEDRHFSENKILTLKTSIDALFKKQPAPKKEEPANNWVAGYKAMLSGYLVEQGIVNKGRSISYGILTFKKDDTLTDHFRTCPKGQTVTGIEEQSFTIPGWDSFRTPSDVPVTLVEGKATCGCGKVNNENVSVYESIHEIMMTTLNNEN